ncbi:uncharacterized protein LOC134094477 [Sardina pilchardus]|uniref:uncharacterized protein LOC134094477 n=1 Tax=Sardina pilchardus TaxID=27697 RepID=UPI002E14B87D
MVLQTQEVQNTRQTVGFEHSEWFSCGPRWVEVKLSCMERLDNSMQKQWWHLTNTFYMETPEGSRYQYASAKFVTYIQRYCGGIIHVSSRLETEANLRLEMDGVQMVEISQSFQEMTISGNGRVSTTERTKTILVPAPTFPPPEPAFGPILLPDLPLPLTLTPVVSTLMPDLTPMVMTLPVVLACLALVLSTMLMLLIFVLPVALTPLVLVLLDRATSMVLMLSMVMLHVVLVLLALAALLTPLGDGDSNLLTEAMQVPSLYQFFLPSGLEDFSLRLNGLRQAFAVLLVEEQYANFITVAGKMILRTMAALNGQDAGAFQEAFDQLVAFVQTPGSAQTIENELLEVQIHHVNLLDVIFEMVFFGELQGTRARLASRVQGGFLDHLVKIIHAFMPHPSEVWLPQAIQCWELLRADMLGFLMEVFFLERSVYSRPQDLSDGLFSCLEQRVDQLLSRMTAT